MRTVIAGSIISSLALLMLAFFLGWKQKRSASGGAGTSPIKA